MDCDREPGGSPGDRPQPHTTRCRAARCLITPSGKPSSSQAVYLPRKRIAPQQIKTSGQLFPSRVFITATNSGACEGGNRVEAKPLALPTMPQPESLNDGAVTKAVIHPSLKTYVFSLKLYNALLYYRKTSRWGPGGSRRDAEAAVRPPEFLHCGNGQGVKP